MRLFSLAIGSKDLSQSDRESAHFERARAYLGLGDKKEALLDLDRALQLNPGDKDIAALRAQVEGTRDAQPRASSDDRSLAETMSFIEQNISAQGVVDYTGVFHDASGQTPDFANQFAADASNVRADPSICRIDYHWTIIRNGITALDKDGSFWLAAVQSVQVISLDQEENDMEALEGRSTTTARTYPSIAVVKIIWTDGQSNRFYFHDEVTAARVAQALKHAAELCGSRPPA